MCGICAIYNHPNCVGNVAKINISQISRGRDATGIAVLEDNAIKIFKRAVTAYEFAKVLPKVKTNICVGHVRAASTNIIDRAKDEESHPFISEKHDFAIVHNGTVRQHDVYRTMLEDMLGHNFTSGVDSEIYVHLLEELLVRHKTRDDAVRHLYKTFDFGNVIILFNDGTLYGLPSNTAFHVAVMDNSVVMASELTGIRTAYNEMKPKNAKVFSLATTTNSEICKVYMQDGKVQLANFGDWDKLDIEDGFFPNRKAMCDICHTTSVMCERVELPLKDGSDTRVVDRCMECHTSNALPEKCFRRNYYESTSTYDKGKKKNRRYTKSSDLDDYYVGERIPKAPCFHCGEIHQLYRGMTFCSSCAELYCNICYPQVLSHPCYRPANNKAVQDIFPEVD